MCVRVCAFTTGEESERERLRREEGDEKETQHSEERRRARKKMEVALSVETSTHQKYHNSESAQKEE